MTHTARVVSLAQGHPPNIDWRHYPPSVAVTVADAADKWQVFWILASDPQPAVGSIVEYDAHHCWWPGVRIGKTLTRDP